MLLLLVGKASYADDIMYDEDEEEDDKENKEEA